MPYHISILNDKEIHMKPKIIIHTQVSLDGCRRGFEDTGIYYRVAARFGEDAVLFGADTVLAAGEQWQLPEKEADFVKPESAPDDKRPLAVVPDSRGRLRCLHLFRNMPYVRDAVVLVSRRTPDTYLAYLRDRNYDFIVAGDDHVDYCAALEALASRYDCRTIRTDSGGRLTNILLEQGLADELSLVISPCLVGDGSLHAFGSLVLQETVKLELMSSEVLDGNYLNVHYNILE
jgi:2,5-diamino-6-(ribosylamino)-4(3H)-pyrimidinone 5'-phosphate reductase